MTSDESVRFMVENMDKEQIARALLVYHNAFRAVVTSNLALDQNMKRVADEFTAIGQRYGKEVNATFEALNADIDDMIKAIQRRKMQ